MMKSSAITLLVCVLFQVPAAAAVDAELRSVDAPRTLATGLLSADEELWLEARSQEFMTAIYESRLADAASLLDQVMTLAPEDPRSYLLQARYLREFLSDQNTHRQTIEDQTPPVYAALKQALEKSEKLLEEDEDDLAGRLYRGWARMFEAQLHTLSASYWSAGRTSKKAKQDLDFVLERDPDNPHAKLLMGAFYYFADGLPGVVKFAAWLLRLPSGDRDLGLRYIREAHESGAFGYQDAFAISGLVHFAFEADFDKALPAFERLADAYPGNARLVEPFAVIDFFWPQRFALDRDRIARCQTLATAAPDSVTRAGGQRLRYYQLLQWQLAGRVAEAREGMARLLEVLPTQPDWLEPSVRLALADLSLLSGDAEGARSAVRPLERDTRPEQWMRYLFEEDEVASPPAEVLAFLRLQPAARALYDDRLVEARRILDAERDEDFPIWTFYDAEFSFLRNHGDAGRAGFEKLAEVDSRDRYYFYRYLSRLRLGEIAAREHDNSKAKEYYERAMDEHKMKDLLRHVANSRRRLFDKHDEAVATAFDLAEPPSGKR